MRKKSIKSENRRIVDSSFSLIAKLVQFLANLAGLGALFLAYHVYKNPTELASFINQVSDASRATALNTEATAENTLDTSRNTAGISKDTTQLVGAIAKAMLIEVQTASGGPCDGSCEAYAFVQNVTNYRFEEVVFEIYSLSEKIVASHRFGLVSPQDAYSHKFSLTQPIGAICITYREVASGQYFFDYRSAGEFSPIGGDLQYKDGNSGIIEPGQSCI